MEFRWVAGLALWTVLSGPVLVDVVVNGKSSRQPQKLVVSHSDANRAPNSGSDYQQPAYWSSSDLRR